MSVFFACLCSIALAASGCAAEAPRCYADGSKTEAPAAVTEQTYDLFSKDLPLEIAWPEIKDPVFRDFSFSDHQETDPWMHLDSEELGHK